MSCMDYLNKIIGRYILKMSLVMYLIKAKQGFQFVFAPFLVRHESATLLAAVSAAEKVLT
jgi:hypothetical protein